MSSFNLILNNNNVVKQNGYSNRLVFKFINGSFTVKPNTKIQLVSAQIPYSFFNISSYYQNNILNIKWPQGNNMTNYTIKIPDGFYSYNDLNNYIKFFCDSNNLYLTNNNGVRQYYIKFNVNNTYYSLELTITPIPSSLPSGWSAPSGFIFPSTIKTPQIEILNSFIGTYLGFNIGLYPSTPQSNLYNILSPNIPKSTNINSILFSCNLINNNISIPSNIFDVIGIYNTEFGSNINYEAKLDKKIELKQGTYNELEIQLLDDDLKLLPILDSNIILNLLITSE